MTVTKLVDLITRIPDPLSLHFYDFSMIFLHFRISLVYTGNLANTPLNKKKEITTGPFAGLLRRHSSPGGVLELGYMENIMDGGES